MKPDKKLIVLYFGNKLIPEDRFAIDIIDSIKSKFPDDIFVNPSSPEEINYYSEYENIIIVDVSPDVDDIFVFKDIDMLKKRKLFSLHDFDLNFFLRLAEKIGYIDTEKIEIFALPTDGDLEELGLKLHELIMARLSR